MKIFFKKILKTIKKIKINHYKIIIEANTLFISQIYSLTNKIKMENYIQWSFRWSQTLKRKKTDVDNYICH